MKVACASESHPTQGAVTRGGCMGHPDVHPIAPDVALESIQEELVPWSNNKNLTGTVSG